MKRNGFTLIELLMVLAIVVILMAICIDRAKGETVPGDYREPGLTGTWTTTPAIPGHLNPVANHYMDPTQFGIVVTTPEDDMVFTPEYFEALKRKRIELLQEDLDELADRLHFDFDKAILDGEAEAIAARVASLVVEHQDIGIIIHGHTDKVGTDEYNQALSELRCEAVARFLVENGMPEERLIEVAFGESFPLVDILTRSRQNRRAEFSIFELQ